MAPIQALLLFSFAVGSAGRLLVRSTPPEAADESAPMTKEAIDEKFDDVDASNKELYEVGCEMQHAADVTAKLAKLMAEGTIKKEDEITERSKIEMQNVKDMRARCQVTAIATKTECDKQCIERHKDHREAKLECNAACKDSSKQWQTDCNNKADELMAAYEQRKNNLAAENACYVSHCESFPAAWKLENEAAVAEKVKEECTEKYKDAAEISSCKAKCDAAKMVGCAKELQEAKEQKDPITAFCAKLWTAILASSKVDWKTGYPKLQTFR